MKKLLTIFFILLPMMMWGQDYESKGDSAYKAGDYEEAEVQYNAALALLKKRRKSMRTLRNTCFWKGN